MDVLRSPASRWITAGLGALAACLGLALPGAAETSSLDVGDQAVVIVQVQGRGNLVTIHTWDRPSVQVDSGEVPASVSRRSVDFGTAASPLAAPIPPMPYVVRDPGGQPMGQGMLPPEDFPYSSFRPGPHDVVRIDAVAGARLTVTVPLNAGMLQTRIGGGRTTIDGYHGSNLFVVQNYGQVHLSGSVTVAFLQMNNGVLFASDDLFDRVRVRTNNAHVLFEHCRAKQIEATSVNGALVYDGGTFEPGLARFDSQSGTIALGVNAPAQLAARAQDGRVYTQFDRGTPVAQPAEGAATATYAGGGPLVNAITTHGNVYLYDGSFASRKTVAPDWRPLHQLFERKERSGGQSPRRPPSRDQRRDVSRAKTSASAQRPT
ncbi:MAG TPA: hypothetical protein VGN14_16830 [Candidatus Elarobacter sp.]